MDILKKHHIVDALAPEWRMLSQAVHARFLTGDFATGMRFVNAVAEAAEAADHHPDVDLRYLHVDMGLISHSAGGITERDLRMAQQISDIAADMNIRSAPEELAELEIALDTARAQSIAPFWAAVLDGEIGGDGDIVAEATGRLPMLWFQPTDEHQEPRQRFHLDVWVPADVAEERIRRAVKSGGTVVDSSHAPSFTVLADRDGNKACICTALDREDAGVEG
ncbi:VOC family protein [Brevibacterium daeguense]|uniref:Putative pterin-4-alpha-carbinolamine dehydratase n=1 Tax=Brevibacterium daeguense TaxID=909936 RepID=A0ABP8EK47_9MICO|nr:4a-hydroxytetrahydrobiopterin dehydratase [Brevibacterium daeguense]